LADCYAALVHWPVFNKNRSVIASALTTIDLHDLARAARTYGLAGFYVLTPLADQKRLAVDMIAHWQSGPGSQYNTTRSDAVSLVRLADDLVDLRRILTEQYGLSPLVVGTSAQNGAGRIGYQDMAGRLAGDRPVVVALGTSWGLADDAEKQCDLMLAPIEGPTEYNHLSVRSAAAVIFDRLFGRTKRGAL
jgi:hypothetical protein